MPPSYRLDLCPCIPVRAHSANAPAMVGFRELFIRAHEISDLALPIPPAASALLRGLVAITSRLTGLDDPDLSAQQWHQQRAAFLSSGRPAFPPTAVHEYFDTYPMDLFHPTRPFLQDPALAHQCTRSTGINSLIYGRPAGNNLAWFTPHRDTAPHPVPSAEAFWHLLLHHAYGPSGGCTTRTVADTAWSKTRAAPLRSTVSFHPHGRTLQETLLLGLVPFQGAAQDTDDACPWELPHPPDPLQPQPGITWPGRLLTGRSPHAVLLVPDATGESAVDAYLTWSTRRPALPAIDPYHIIHTNHEAKTPETRRTPRRADADRANWRDLDALLLAGDEPATVQRPQAFDSLNDLPHDVRSHLRVRVHGFDQEAQVNNRIWYTALTPPIWPWAQEHDPAMAQRIAECRAAAEHLAATLADATRKAWRETTTPAAATAPSQSRSTSRRAPLWTTRAMAAYWPRAQNTFYEILHDTRPPRGMFARDAIAALRDTTVHALTQHPGAGRAIARAQRQLAIAGSAGGPPPPKGQGRA